MKPLLLTTFAAVLAVGALMGTSYLKSSPVAAAAPAAVAAAPAPGPEAPPAADAKPKAHKLVATPSKAAQSAEAETGSNQDPLRAPKGAKVAIIVFEDLQCPMCSRAAPQVEKASATYKIPVVRHDFPLPKHDWSLQAAIIARFFDQTSKDTGNQFRDYMFSNQTQINPGNLRNYAETFAASRKIALPFVVDPEGKLAAQVSEDKNLGQKIGLDHTPTIYIVSSKPGVKPVEVSSDLNNLYAMIDSALKQ